MSETIFLEWILAEIISLSMENGRIDFCLNFSHFLGVTGNMPALEIVFHTFKSEPRTAEIKCKYTFQPFFFRVIILDA